MKTLLVHGCYDHETLKTLLGLGIKNFGFDLRATSSNLVTFRELKALLTDFTLEEVTLVFENDKSATVLSFVDLLRGTGTKLMLEFRDQQGPAYYHGLNLPFLWMFHPEGDWRTILLLQELQGVLLPLKWRSDYQHLTELWDLIDHRGLNVYLHADDLVEAASIEHLGEVNVSVDLTSEIEKSFRCVDQERLKMMQLWRKLNESPSV